MNETSSASSSVGPAKSRLQLLAYAFMAVTVIITYVGDFLEYLRPDTADWLEGLSIACLLVTPVLILAALLFRRWSSAGILMATLLLSYLPAVGTGQSLNRLITLGFRIHASPLSEYLSKCDRIDFVEKGVNQTVGWCERRGFYSGYAHTVIYDTTGNLLKAEAEKSPEWKRAMDKYYSEEVLATSQGRTAHIIDHFYSVGHSVAEDRG
jgi:hypothetical protein